MTWIILLVAALVAGALAGRIIAPRLADRFPTVSHRWIAIGAATFVPLLIVVLAAVLAVFAYESPSNEAPMRDLAASITFYVGLLCAVMAGLAGEMAALWALRRLRR